jgi:hypothetical protein
MARRPLTALFALAATLALAPARFDAADAPNLAGTWAINRSLSEFPREVGFGMDLLAPGRAAESADEGVRAGGSGAPVLASSRESETDARNTRQLVGEVRQPPGWLKVTHTDTAVSFTDDSGRTRTFHTNGKEEVQQLEAGPVSTTARWEGARLVVRYRVSQGRELRYTYARSADPPRLVVEAQLIERGGRDLVKRVYDLLPPGAPTPAPAPAARTTAAARTAGAADERGATPSPPDLPASSDRRDVPSSPQKPDADLAGIRNFGLVVEELTSQAAVCGLDRAAIESAVSKRFTDAGFTVRRNADEDTYIYVDIISASVSNGLCVSRYDTSLFTHATATLPHGTQPVLVRVLLLHEGGIAGGGPKEHADRVTGNLLQHVDRFVAKIRAAGRE